VIGEQVSGERVIGDAPASSAAGQTYSSGSAQPHRATRSPQQ
jgi:hypothetical protein